MTFPNGGTGNCSGTVVSRTLMLTAAHCLYSIRSGNVGYMTRILFAPGMWWDNLSDPNSIRFNYGVFDAYRWWVPDGWRLNGDPAFDYGLVEFAPQPSYIGNVTGSWNITPSIQWGDGARVYLMGYPSAGHWSTIQGGNGRGQYACDSIYENQYSVIGSGYELWMTCTMNQGASGGPWFVLLNNGTWTIGGVNDRCWGPNMNDPVNYCTPYSDYMRASYFDNRFLDFWISVQGQLTY
jgi:Trypsin-like peptidase domain